MAKEIADVVLGGQVVGYAQIETDAARTLAELASAVLFGHPSSVGSGGEEGRACACCPEGLAFAKVRSRRGDRWFIGVRLCATHCRIRPA
jgi:hypothetical protein